MEHVEEESVHGYTVRVYYDEDPMNPRGWDNVGVMVCGHRRYDLGDEQGPTHVETISELVEWARNERGATVVLPLYLLDHSGLAMRTGPFHEDPGGWDSGIVGIIFDTPETLENTGVLPEHVESALRGEVETYDSYLQGQVFGYVVTDYEGDIVESCWGYFDEDDALAEGISSAEYLHEHAPQPALPGMSL